MKLKVILKEKKYINEEEPEDLRPVPGKEAADTEVPGPAKEDPAPETVEPEENTGLSVDKYLEQLNELLQRAGSEVSKDFKILIAAKDKAVQNSDFNTFWNTLEKILEKEEANRANLEKIFPGIFGVRDGIMKSVVALEKTADVGNEIGDINVQDSAGLKADGEENISNIGLSAMCPPDNSEDPDIKRLWKGNIQLDKKGNVIDSKGNVLIDKMKNRKGGTERRELAAITWLLKNKRFPNLSDLANEEVQAFFNTDLLKPNSDLAQILSNAKEWPVTEEIAIKFALGTGGGPDSPILKIVGQAMGSGGGLDLNNQQAWNEVQEFFEGKWTPEKTEKIKKETPEFCDAINEFIKRYMLNGMMDWQSKTKLKFINKYTTKLTKDQVTKGTDPGSKDPLRRGAGVSITANPEGSEEIASLKKKLEDLAKKEDLWKGKANMWDRVAPGDARLGKGKGKDAPKIKQAEARVRELQKDQDKIRDELASNPKYIKKYFFNPFKHKKGESEELKVGADGSLDPRWNKSPGDIKTKKELDALEAKATEWKKSQGLTENINFYDLTDNLINENENLTSDIGGLLDRLKAAPTEDQEKIVKALQKNVKLIYTNTNSYLKNSKQEANNFKKWVTDGLERLHKEPNFESEMKKQHPQGWPVVFFVQNQQYVESLQAIYAALHIITAFRDDMVKLATAVDNKFDGITKSVGSRIDRLPAEKPREPGEPVIQEEVEMVDAPEVELNPVAAKEEPAKDISDELLNGISDIQKFYEKVYEQFNIESEINEALKIFAQWFRHALLGKSSALNKSLDMASTTDIGTGKKKGIYESIIKENCIVNNESNVDLSQLENIVARFYPYVKEKLKFDQDAKLNLISDPENAKDAWGKTAYYNPETMEITVFVDNRHPKDMLRSISHELVHHSQNCRGEFDQTQALEPGYAQNDPHMRRMEGEAYLLGNGFLVRDFEDYLKSQQNQNLTENKKMKGLTKEQLKTVLENTIKRVMKESKLEEETTTEVVEETEETVNEEEVVEEMFDAMGAPANRNDDDEPVVEEGEEVVEETEEVIEEINETFTSKKDQLLFEKLTKIWTK